MKNTSSYLAQFAQSKIEVTDTMKDTIFSEKTSGIYHMFAGLEGNIKMDTAETLEVEAGPYTIVIAHIDEYLNYFTAVVSRSDGQPLRLTDLLVYSPHCVNHLIYEEMKKYVDKLSKCCQDPYLRQPDMEQFYCECFKNAWEITINVLKDKDPIIRKYLYQNMASKCEEKVRENIVMGCVMLFLQSIMCQGFRPQRLVDYYTYLAEEYSTTDDSTPYKKDSFFLSLSRAFINKKECQWSNNFEQIARIETEQAQQQTKWFNLAKKSSDETSAQIVTSTFNGEQQWSEHSHTPPTSASVKEAVQMNSPKVEAMRKVFRRLFCNEGFLPSLKSVITEFVHKKSDLKHIYIALKREGLLLESDKDRWKDFANMLLVCELLESTGLVKSNTTAQSLADSIRKATSTENSNINEAIREIKNDTTWRPKIA